LAKRVQYLRSRDTPPYAQAFGSLGLGLGLVCGGLDEARSMTDPSRRERTLIHLRLLVGEELLEAEVNVPVDPIRPVDLLPILMSLDDAFLGVIENETTGQGKVISCQKGCGACCRQLVPIGDVEAYYLAEIVSEMPDARRSHVESRFREGLDRLDRRGMLERLRRSDELTTREERRQLGIDYFACGVSCPFLEEEACSIHRDRPLVCREYLVTSPPEYCAHPLPQQIARVRLPVMLSKVLSQFGDGVGRRPARWLPLVLALEWVANQGEVVSARVPGPEMFENFLKLVAKWNEKARSAQPADEEPYQ
jgi:Fe-S-cluster containining protein